MTSKLLQTFTDFCVYGPIITQRRLQHTLGTSPDSDDDSRDSIDAESNEVDSDSAPDSDYSDSDL